MSSKFNKYLVFLAIAALLLANTALGYAVEVQEVNSPDQSPAQPTQDEKNAQFLERVKQEVELNKSDYRQLLNSISDTTNRLNLVTEEKMTLQAQLVNLDSQVEASKQQLLDVTKQVVEKENEITLLYEQIDVNQVAMNYQVDQLKDYVKTLYQEEKSMLTQDDDGSVDAFKLLLTDGSVGQNMRQLDYFNVLDEAGRQMADKLDELGKDLLQNKIDLELKKAKLEVLEDKLAKDKEQLDLQKKSKEDLLKITMGQEEIFKQLLEQTLKQQNQMVEDIKNLANSMAFLQGKVAEEGANFDATKYRSILDYRTQALYSFHISNLNNQGGQFAWPVDPDKGVSAYFHDPRYVGTFGVQHNAIDIPQYQGTPVRAAADGVVYVARDNGYGYSYIILSHAGGFMTVYGHISNVLVASGQTIVQGAIIGLSGGMPGSPGAGYMTTGPHLHFEVQYNGKYVDPLNYLPLKILNKELVEKLPQKYQEVWTKEVLGEANEALSRDGEVLDDSGAVAR